MELSRQTELTRVLKSMRIKILLIVFLMLAGCSSKPEKSYQVTNFKQAGIDLTRLADRKRQQEAYQDALEMYLSAESYALQSNDQKKIGINKLKRALIYIVLADSNNAQTLIQEVEQANRIERLELAQAIKFVNAKLLLTIVSNL